MPSVEEMLMIIPTRALAATRSGSESALRQEERRLQVQVNHFVPAAFRKSIEIFSPRRAGVVDQNVQRRLMLCIGGQFLVNRRNGKADRAAARERLVHLPAVEHHARNEVDL